MVTLSFYVMIEYWLKLCDSCFCIHSDWKYSKKSVLFSIDRVSAMPMTLY